MRRIRKALMVRYIIFMIVLVISLMALVVSIRNYMQIDEFKNNSKVVILNDDGTITKHMVY